MSNKKTQEYSYVCDVCKEEYVGAKRKWTCPICGNADTYVLSDEYNKDEDDERDSDYDYN